MKLLTRGKKKAAQRRHLLFTYGTMMTGNRNRERIKDGKYAGDARTTAAYTLWCLGYAPGAVMRGKQEVHGEVYWIDDDLLCTVDGCEGAPWKYKRQQIDVFVTKGKKAPVRHRAWIYVLLDEWADEDGKFIVEDGRWAQPKDWEAHYYCRTPRYRGGSTQDDWRSDSWGGGAWDDYERVYTGEDGQYVKGLNDQTLGTYDPGEIEELFDDPKPKKGKARVSLGWYHVQKRLERSEREVERVGFIEVRVNGKPSYQYVWNGWVWAYETGRRVCKATAGDYTIAKLDVPKGLLKKPAKKAAKQAPLVTVETEIPDVETECDNCGAPLVWDRETDRFMCVTCKRDVNDMIDADVRRYSLLVDDEPDAYEQELIDWDEIARSRAHAREHPSGSDVQAALRQEAQKSVLRHRRNGKAKARAK